MLRALAPIIKLHYPQLIGKARVPSFAPSASQLSTRQPSTPNPQRSTLNPQPSQTVNPEPDLKPARCMWRRSTRCSGSFGRSCRLFSTRISSQSFGSCLVSPQGSEFRFGLLGGGLQRRDCAWERGSVAENIRAKEKVCIDTRVHTHPPTNTSTPTPTHPTTYPTPTRTRTPARPR